MAWSPVQFFKSIYRAGQKSPAPDPEEVDALLKTKGFAMAIQQALGSGQAGQWASDHRTESDQYDGWTYVAIRAICLQLMQAQVNVYDEEQSSRPRKSLKKSLYAGEDGDATPLPNTHPLCRLLKNPNPTQSGAMFRYEQGLQLQLTGSCIIWNVPNRLGKPVQRYVIPTAIASPVAPSVDLPNGGYRIQSTSSRYAAVDESGFVTSGIFNQVSGRVIPVEQLQINRWPHPVYKDDGQSPVSAGARWIDSANQIDQARWSQMNNGADPSVVVNVDPAVKPNQALLDEASTAFNQKYAGVDKTGKAIFTYGGQTVSLTTTPKDMSYKESFEQLRDSIMALHGVPGIAAGLSDGGSYAAFYASIKQFTHLTVQPILDLMAEDDTEQLAPYFGHQLLVEMEAASIDDPEVLDRRLTLDISSGAITRDEYRAATGRPPLGPENGGDELIGGVPPAPAGGPGGYAPDESSTGYGGAPEPKFLRNKAAMKKAADIVGLWDGYPGGRP